VKSIKSLLVVMLLLCLPVYSVWAQQSTTGPTPPPGMDPGHQNVTKAQVVIPGVPAYIWHHGCGPTAVGMVIGYWDGNGCPNMVPGDATTQTNAVEDMMADDSQNPSCAAAGSDHYQDYSCPIDNYPNLYRDLSELGGAHTSNCVADFMETSWSSRGNRYGWSYYSDVPGSFIDYVNLVAPQYNPTAANHTYSNFSFATYQNEINNGRPVVLLVDSNGDGQTDHFVPAIGYDNVTNEYACLNTWDMSIHWYQWRPMSASYSWGVYGATVFNVTVSGCPDLTPRSFTLSGAQTAYPGESLKNRFYASVENIGNILADSSAVGFYISTNSIISHSDQLLIGGREGIGTLSPGSYTTVTMNGSMTIPVSWPTGPAWLGIIVDEQSDLTECDEANNTAYIPINIYSIPEMSVVPDSFYQSLPTNGFATQYMTIYNDGDGPLNFYISQGGKGAFESSIKDVSPNSALPNLRMLDAFGNPLNPDDVNNEPVIPAIDQTFSATNNFDYVGGGGDSKAMLFADDFEDGDYVGWLDAGGSGDKEVTGTTAANGTVYSYHEYNSPYGNADGVYQLFNAIQPDHISFYIRSGSTSQNDAYFVLKNGSGSQLLWFFAQGNGNFYLNGVSDGGHETYAYSANTWYHVEFRNMNFVSQTFDYYVNSVLVMANIPFRNSSVYDIGRLDIYNFDSGTQAWWDEIEIENTTVPDWLAANPTAGIVPAHSSVSIAVTFDASGLSDGDYYNSLFVTGNDPFNQAVSVPAHLHVSSTVPDIAVSPDSLEESLPIGGTSTQIMTIYNNGAGSLDFGISHYHLAGSIPPPKPQASPSVPSDYIGSIQGAQEISLIPETELRKTFGGTSDRAVDVFVISSSQSFMAGADTLVAHLAQYSDIGLVTLFNAELGTPTTAEMLGYDVVVMTTDQSYAAMDSACENVADYLDQGGKVVLTTFCWANQGNNTIIGRLLTDYSPYQIGGTSLYSWADLGLYVTDHPIFQGVSTLHAYYRDNVTLSPGAALLATWNDNHLMVAEKGSVVGINTALHGPDPVVSNGWTGDGWTLLHNAVIYLTDSSWLTYSPLSGTIPSGSNMDITVGYNAAGLSTDDYYANILVASNDPDEPVVTVPVHLEVASPPDIAVIPDSLEESLSPGGSSSQIMTIYNYGDGDLHFGISDYPGTGLLPIPPLPPSSTGLNDYMGGNDLAQGIKTIPNTVLRKTFGNSSERSIDVFAISAAQSYTLGMDTLAARLAQFPGIGTVTIFDAELGTPTTAEMLSYDVVLMTTDQPYANIDSACEHVAAYLDMGGKVVMTTFCWANQSNNTIRGRLLTDYSPFQIAGSTVYSWADLGSFIPDHPVFQGVSSLHAYFHDYVSLSSGAVLLAAWDDGHLFAAEKGDVVAINTSIHSPDPVAPYNGWTGDGWTLLYNAVTYLVSTSWLTYTPSTGTIPSGGNMDITVGFNAAGLSADDYYANILVASNDPDEPVVTVPAHLHVFSSGCSFDIAEVDGPQYQPVGVPILACNVQNVAGIEFHINNDSSIVWADSISSSYLTGATVGALGYRLNIIWEDFMNPITFAEGDTVLTLWYTCIGSIGEVSSLVWTGNNEMVDSNGDPIPGLSYSPGSVTIVEPFNDLAGHIYYYDLVKRIPGVDVDIVPVVSPPQTTNATGYYIFGSLAPDTYTLGASRTNNDPGVSVADIIKIRRHLAMLEVFDTPYKLAAADVNNSSSVSVADVIKLRRYLAQLENLVSGNWKFIDSGYAITDLNWFLAPQSVVAPLSGADIVDASFIGVRMGDVNNTWSPVKTVKLSNISTKSIHVGEVQGSTGEIVSLPVMLEGNTEMAGVELHLNYDSEQLSFIKAVSTLPGELTLNDTKEAIHIVWEDIEHITASSDNEPLMTLQFEILPDLTNRTEIELVRGEIVNAIGQAYQLDIAHGCVARGVSSILPEDYHLAQNRPNPFNPATEISFSLPQASDVCLEIYNIVGQRVTTLVNGHLDAGVHTLIWDGSQSASGVYFYRLQAGRFDATKKMILLK